MGGCNSYLGNAQIEVALIEKGLPLPYIFRTESETFSRPNPIPSQNGKVLKVRSFKIEMSHSAPTSFENVIPDPDACIYYVSVMLVSMIQCDFCFVEFNIM